MATPTYTLIDSVTLGASSASVTFSSIPQTYGDLVLVMKSQTDSSTTFEFRFNGDNTGGNYYSVLMQGNGSSAYSSSGNQNGLFFSNNNPMTTFNIMDYSATNKHKSVLIRLSAASGAVIAAAARWANTSAITSINFVPGSGSFSAGGTFYLYGIAKAL